MRAIIDATGYREGIAFLLHYKPTPLLSIGGKPIIFHVIEYLIQQGVTQIDLVLCHLPQKIENLLDSGQRWGINITYHLACDSRYPFQAIRPLLQQLDQDFVLFGQGDSLPAMDPICFQNEGAVDSLLWMLPDLTWSGWGFLSTRCFGGVPTFLTVGELPLFLDGRYRCVTLDPFISAHTYHELYDSNIRFLQTEHQLSVYPTTARCVEKGIWISRGVSLHSTAKIIAPVFIGEFSQIHKDVIIGPNVVIEDFCFIDDGSKIVDSLICRSSYVGVDLNIHESIVDRNLLVNLSHGSHVIINDEFILGSSSPGFLLSGLLKCLERGVAFCLFLVLFPLFLWMLFTHRLTRMSPLRLPAAPETVLWKTFEWEIFEPKNGGSSGLFCRLFFWLPLLRGIMLGYVHFVGVAPRTPEDVLKMPTDWMKLYLNSKVGIIAVSDLNDADNPDNSYASEALYASRQSVGYDVELIFRWMARKLRHL